MTPNEIQILRTEVEEDWLKDYKRTCKSKMNDIQQLEVELESHKKALEQYTFEQFKIDYVKSNKTRISFAS